MGCEDLQPTLHEPRLTGQVNNEAKPPTRMVVCGLTREQLPMAACPSRGGGCPVWRYISNQNTYVNTIMYPVKIAHVKNMGVKLSALDSKNER